MVGLTIAFLLLSGKQTSRFFSPATGAPMPTTPFVDA